MVLNVPILGQHTLPWGRQRLGTVNGTTIGSHGCLVTCLTMANQFFGGGGNPADVDNLFTDHGGYTSGNLVTWSKIQELLPNLRLARSEFTPNTPANLGNIKAHLDAGGVVVCEVRWRGLADKQHWVLAVGYNGNDIIVNDPETGSRTSFASKLFGSGDSARDILTARYFVDAIVPAPPAPAPAPQPTPGRGSGPAQEVNMPVPMSPQEAAQAYRDVLHREPESDQVLQNRNRDEFYRGACEELNTALAAARSTATTALGNSADKDTVISGLQTQLTEALNRLNDMHQPTFRDSYNPVDEPTTLVAQREGEAIDFAHVKPNQPVPKGMQFDCAGAFAVDGVTYVRTLESEKNGDWYGTPLHLFHEQSADDPQQDDQKLHVGASMVYGLLKRLEFNIKNWLANRLNKRSS
jgi:hypothetical protein